MIPALPISVSSTGNWKQRPKAVTNLIVIDRYSATEPWNTIPASASRLASPSGRTAPSGPAGIPACWKVRKKLNAIGSTT